MKKRLTIARLVNDGATFTEIAKAVGKSSSTIAKEIKKYAYEKRPADLVTHTIPAISGWFAN